MIYFLPLLPQRSHKQHSEDLYLDTAAVRCQISCKSPATMPFLRRRGNVASETDMRRHTLFNAPRTSFNDEDAPVPLEPSMHQPTVPEEFVTLSQQVTHDSESPEHSSEQSLTDLERQNKFRRFSILKYRNASDSQLSLRAKQQAETPPPVPRRML